LLYLKDCEFPFENGDSQSLILSVLGIGIGYAIPIDNEVCYYKATYGLKWRSSANKKPIKNQGNMSSSRASKETQKS